MTSKVDRYASYFPDELARSIKGFDNKIRRAIIAALIVQGDSAFMELAQELDISKGLLAHHLEVLLDSSWIRNYSPIELKGRFDSFYGMTTLGDSLVESFRKAFSPRVRPVGVRGDAWADSAGNLTTSGSDQQSPPRPPLQNTSGTVLLQT